MNFNTVDPADELDAALDHLMLEPDAGVKPSWVGDLHRQLTALDHAFTRGGQIASGADSSGVIAPPRSRQLPPSERRSRLRMWPIAVAALAAVLAALVFGGNRAGWYGPEQTRHIAGIPQEGTLEVETVSEIVVTPTTCTIPPLTRERYDRIMGAATPPSGQVFSKELNERTSDLQRMLEFKTVEGDVIIGAGVPLPASVAESLEHALATYLGCANAGNLAAMSGFMSDDYIRLIPDPENWFSENNKIETPTSGPQTSWQLEQPRLLEDGRVVAVNSHLPSETAGVNATPEVGVVRSGTILVFVRTADGWKLDFAQSGRLLTSDLNTTGTPQPQ